jgi:hypothetical protein
MNVVKPRNIMAANQVALSITKAMTAAMAMAIRPPAGVGFCFIAP